MCLHDNWSSGDGGVELRELDDIRLDEVSILTNIKSPAYIATSIEVRDDELLERRAAEDTAEIADNTPKSPDFSVMKAELELLSLGGKKYE